MRQRVEQDRTGEARDRGDAQHPATPIGIPARGHVRDGEDEAHHGDERQDTGGETHSAADQRQG